jgi:hypothetical protein
MWRSSAANRRNRFDAFTSGMLSLTDEPKKKGRTLWIRPAWVGVGGGREGLNVAAKKE